MKCATFFSVVVGQFSTSHLSCQNHPGANLFILKHWITLSIFSSTSLFNIDLRTEFCGSLLGNSPHADGEPLMSTLWIWSIEKVVSSSEHHYSANILLSCQKGYLARGRGGLVKGFAERYATFSIYQRIKNIRLAILRKPCWNWLCKNCCILKWNVQ